MRSEILSQDLAYQLSWYWTSDWVDTIQDQSTGALHLVPILLWTFSILWPDRREKHHQHCKRILFQVLSSLTEMVHMNQPNRTHMLQFLKNVFTKTLFYVDQSELYSDKANPISYRVWTFHQKATCKVWTTADWKLFQREFHWDIAATASSHFCVVFACN